MAVCPHKGLDLPTIHSELIISKMVYCDVRVFGKEDVTFFPIIFILFYKMTGAARL